MKHKNSHTWLFAFTDLAFLLLISLSLIPSAPDNITLRLSEMDLPTVPENQNLNQVDASDTVWELQVCPVSEENPTPYRLVQTGVSGSQTREQGVRYLSADELIPALAQLKGRFVRPALLPRKTSLTQDFLFAAGAVARVWGEGHSQALVKPVNPETL